MPPNTAIGTFFSGFSTASLLAQADSIPKNAHKVMAIEEPTASKNGKLCGFQELMYCAGLNHHQPIIEIPTTGMITPQTVMLLICPVIRAPPKFAIVQIHNTTIVAIQIPNGVIVASISSAP